MNADSDNTPQDASLPPLRAFSDALAALVDAVGRGTLGVLGRGGRAVASAVVWRPGVVVTAAHVFRRTPAAVTLAGEGGTPFDATLAGIDSSTDIAVFRVADAALTPVEFGDASAVRAGHLVVAIGRSAQGDLSASHGIVNRASGPWQTWLGGQVDRLIRLDGGLHDGLSGGPVADADGRVIGIGSAALSRSHGVVVTASTVSRVVDALLSKGRVSRAFLGIGAQPVEVPTPSTAGVTAEAQSPISGLLVTSLASGGPAQAAGILVGDIVIDVAGQPAATLHDLRASLSGRAGETVPVSLLRGGARAQASITVGEWPARAHRC